MALTTLTSIDNLVAPGDAYISNLFAKSQEVVIAAQTNCNVLVEVNTIGGRIIIANNYPLVVGQILTLRFKRDTEGAILETSPAAGTIRATPWPMGDAVHVTMVVGSAQVSTYYTIDA